MEFFNKAKAVRLRSHLGKYLLADGDEETVRQSGNGSSPKARWTVEFVEGYCHVIRLKSCYGKYLTASDEHFLLGMTGKKVVQAIPTSKMDSSIEWEPLKAGLHVKLRTRGGKFLRANGGTPPWRNTVTHDVPNRTATQDWVLWGVDMVDILEFDLVSNFISPASSFSSLTDDFMGSSDTGSPAVSSFRGGDHTHGSFSSLADDSRGSSDTGSPAVASFRGGDHTRGIENAMELFHKAKSVRLRSHHDKYLLAEDDQESVCQDRNGTCKYAKWTVEFVEWANVIRLKSCFGKYLTASNVHFLLGMTGKKVLQTTPRRLDSSVEWEPIREGFQVRLKTRYGNFLRANSGLPPWRNSITHDIPHRTATQDWVLWDVDIVEFLTDPPNPQPVLQPVDRSDSSLSEPNSPSTISMKSPTLESSDSFSGSPVKSDGRLIHYIVANDNEDVDNDIEAPSFNFKGNGVEELKQKLEEETGLEDIIVCSRNPLNGKLYPLRLRLPPNNTTMRVVLVPSSSKAARDIVMP